jgi:hypothetical protein
MWPESTNQKSPCHSDEEVHFQGNTTVKSSFSSEFLSKEKEEVLPLGQVQESSQKRMIRWGSRTQISLVALSCMPSAGYEQKQVDQCTSQTP